jgi:2-dehydro-3-deoxyphosphogluconate aldolase / (4S)-4-hydroxy-2-oxoglutarate aldolase
MSATATYDAIRRSRLVAILRSTDPGSLVAGAEVLVEEGVTTLELPLTSATALTAIERLVTVLAGRASVGAGTVRTFGDARAAIDVGAEFLVTPALNVSVVEVAVKHDLAVLPGVVTPTEYETARSAGAHMVKLFPAQSLGPAYLRHLRVPFPEIEAVATAGISLQDASDWLGAGAVALGVGSPLTERFLETGDFDGLRERARAWQAVVT